MSSNNSNNRRRNTAGKRKTKSGVQALTSMIRQSKDQVVATVKSRYTGNNAPANIAMDLKRILSLVNTEDKQVYNLAVAANCLQNTPIIYGIGTMAQGTSGAQRIGDSIKINKIDLLLAFTYSSGVAATSSVANQVFNWYLLRYKKTVAGSGTTNFPIADLLNADDGGNYTPMSFPNPDNNENFQIMSNGQISISLQLTPDVSSVQTQVTSVSHDCSFHQTYTGAANTTIADNMCFVVIVALNPSNAGGVSQVRISSAMWFIDN